MIESIALGIQFHYGTRKAVEYLKHKGFPFFMAYNILCLKG